jgi:hypothetical protein
MRTKKNMLRIGTLITILMFLLIPLMSSPVAAGFTSPSTGETENSDGAAVEASITSIPDGPYPIRYYDNAPRTATFTFTIVFVDSSTSGQGSLHYAVLYVERLTPEMGPLVDETGLVPLTPGQSTVPPIILSVNDNWNENDEKLWHVYVQIGCRKLPDGEWVEDSDNYQVEMK